MALSVLSRRRQSSPEQLATKAIKVYNNPATLSEVPVHERSRVDELVKAIRNSGYQPMPGKANPSGPVLASQLSRSVANRLAPGSSITPVAIEAAMNAQGMNMVLPFAPGQPLTPYYGYGKQPRQYDYKVDRNVTTETRPDRIPFHTLLRLFNSYDIASSCTRYSINDLRSMSVRFEAMDGYEKNAPKEIAEVKKRLRRPDGKRFFRNWLAMNQRNLWIFDSAPIYRQRDNAGNVKALKNISAMTIAPMVDYFGDIPESPAPAFQQYIEGVPWDWLSGDDIIYEPFWPETDSPYGTPPLETVLINANTDIRLQMYFLDFFTKGQVPEMLAIAPEDKTDPDAIAELTETYNDWTYGDQAERWGLRWLPAGTELIAYQAKDFNPDVAEYVMRRTVAAYGLTPQNLGILDDVNRATSDTQVDQQFRVSSLPTAGYYEDIFDSIIQDDWGFPVQMRFNTGREKEDRLNEAKAHQIYVAMGAERASEVREKVLGFPVDPNAQVPLFWDSQRMGVVPMDYILSIAGTVDPRTGMPVPGTTKPREYVVPGTSQDGPEGVANQNEAATPGPGRPKAKAPKGGKAAAKPVGKRAAKELMPGDPQPNAVASPESPSAEEETGYGYMDSQGSPANGTAAIRAEADDLKKWRANARKAVARSQKPRMFVDSAIRPELANKVWEALKDATSREAVDAAFGKARGPIAAGIVVQALDTRRVLMVQRTPDKHDPKEAYARWEFPGGRLDGGVGSDDASPWGGAVREWSEETGADLPESFQHVGNWTSPDGLYLGFVVTVPRESDLQLDPDGDEVSHVAWWDKEDLNDPAVRDKVTGTLDRITPMLKAQATWGDFHRHTDAIVDHFTPQVEEAMAEMLQPLDIQRAIQTAYSPGLQKALAANFFQHVKRAFEGMRRVLAKLYGESYMQGAHEAAEASSGDMPPWTATVRTENGWDAWGPGMGDDASLVAGGGLAQLLRDRDIWIKEMSDTQVNRIGDAINAGIAKGFPIAEVTAAVDAIVHDTARAKMIAETEYARARHISMMETYRLNQVPALEWLAEPTACTQCKENEAASPQPTAAPVWPQGEVPVHPHERCVVAPYYGTRG